MYRAHPFGLGGRLLISSVKFRFTKAPRYHRPNSDSFVTIRIWFILLNLLSKLLHVRGKAADCVMPVVMHEESIKDFQMKDSLFEDGFFTIKFLNLKQKMINGKVLARTRSQWSIVLIRMYVCSPSKISITTTTEILTLASRDRE
jgi:hypothetical protein